MSTGELRAARWVAPRRHPLTKVPEVTLYFWITKVLTTGMGEATSDYLVHRFNPEIAVVVGFTVFGTMAADVLHVGLGIPYAVSTVFFMVVLAVIFVLWYRSEGTLSIHSIYTRRREVFYWATVLATFALGTAAGDLTAKVFGLGYLGSGILFAVVIAVPYVGYRWFGLNAIVAFWFAYIITRPLGASFADWLAWPPSVGGLGLGHGTVSLVSSAIIVGFVAYLAVSHKDVMVRRVEPGPSARPGPAARSRPPARSAFEPGSGASEPRPGVYDRPVQSGRHRRQD